MVRSIDDEVDSSPSHGSAKITAAVARNAINSSRSRASTGCFTIDGIPVVLNIMGD